MSILPAVAANGMVYVRMKGLKSEKGKFGHMDAYDREFWVRN